MCQKAIKLCQATNDVMQLSRAYLYLSLVNHSLVKYDELREENAERRRMGNIILWTSVAVVTLLILAMASLLFAFRQKKRLAESQRRIAETREESFTNVTHELRTPLTVIQGVAKEMKGTEKADIIQRQAQHLLALVNQILDISKVKMAIGEPATTEGDLAAYVAMIVEHHQDLARQKEISIDYDAGEQAIETVFAADYTEKLVGNLLSNAIKYTPKGGHVNVTLRCNAARDKVTFVVSDTGKGIAKEHLPHVFEPFYRADSEVVGSGVGLALVKEITEKAGGSISVESTLGKGSTFTVTVPLKVSTPQAQKKVMKPQSQKRVMKPQAQMPVLLIVEDNADVAALIGRQMKGRYIVYFATDGEDGIMKAHKLMPDLIITDLMMPGTDGLELCQEIIADEATNHIPIVVVTAKTTGDDRIKARKAGADAYLSKPYNAEELAVCVEMLLEQRERLRQRFRTTEMKRQQGFTEPESQTFPFSSSFRYKNVPLAR